MVLAWSPLTPPGGAHCGIKVLLLMEKALSLVAISLTFSSQPC